MTATNMNAGDDVTGLIGHTGFVGGTLARTARFSAGFNSTNVDSLRGRSFDLLVCAGVSAVKWWANKEPDADRAGIVRLTDALAEARAREFILISTIDVYPDPAAGLDESAAIGAMENHAYGRHRLKLEEWVSERFANVRVIRLPALFGTGLRKNALYDLLHDNMVGSINPAGVFQWYPTARLWNDIQTARAAGLNLVNLFPPPITMSQIIAAFFPGARVGPETRPAPRYDLRTRHADLFGGRNGHILSAPCILGEMAGFIAGVRGAATTPQ
jgi:hypothetical protein